MGCYTGSANNPQLTGLLVLMCEQGGGGEEVAQHLRSYKMICYQFSLRAFFAEFPTDNWRWFCAESHSMIQS